MHTNNNHNNWSAGQLSNIIDSIRDSNNGKCSIRMVGERIGKNTWETWSLLNEAGLTTRIYSESLNHIYVQVVSECETTSIKEAYRKFGTSWKNETSFRGSMYASKLVKLGKPKKPGNLSANTLVKDYIDGGYDFRTLTVAEISEMYELSLSATYRLLKRNHIPYGPGQRGRIPKANA